MTGTHCHTCRGLTHTQPVGLADLPTMGSAFRDAGYATASIGKVHIRGEDATRDLGFDERALRYYTYQYKDYVDAVGAENVDRYNSYRIGSGVSDRLRELGIEVKGIYMLSGPSGAPGAWRRGLLRADSLLVPFRTASPASYTFRRRSSTAQISFHGMAILLHSNHAKL